MGKKWILFSEGGNEMIRCATEDLCEFLSEKYGFEPEIDDLSTLNSENITLYNCIIIFRYSKSSFLFDMISSGIFNLEYTTGAYSIYAGKNIYNPEKDMIAICGNDESGAYYGCSDFIVRYLSDVANKGEDIWRKEYFFEYFEKGRIKEFSFSSHPEIKTRGIWTWGHVIYNYKKFFRNMARLKLNEIVIWGDYAPDNANDVSDYAHKFGIKVIWGYSWGWDVNCREIFENLNEETYKELVRHIIYTYENEYAKIKGDGIYFQTFTELSSHMINGKSVPDLAVKLVNEVSSSLLEKYPKLHIQFGLHATSVKNMTDIISKTDKRVYIVWEDCGSFPYSYDSGKTEGFSETLDFTKNISCLRGEDERCGVVYKGMLKLDWSEFSHPNKYKLKENDEEMMNSLISTREKIWKISDGNWCANAPLAKEITENLKGNDKTIILALIEDGMFEYRIHYSAVIYSEILWNPSEKTENILKYSHLNQWIR